MKKQRLTTGLLIAAIAIPAMADNLSPVPVIPQAQEFNPTPAPPNHEVPVTPTDVTVQSPIIQAPVSQVPIVQAPVPAAGLPTIQEPIHYDQAPIPLFTKVKYVDRHEAHPCAITKIIKVNNPCVSRKVRKLSCCDESVYIEICVPPCGCERVKCRRRGDRVRYDYGKYKVDVRIRNGFVVVDYKD